MNNLFEISSEERNRILNLHEGATKRQYLTLEQAGQQSGGITNTTTTSSTSFPEQNVGNQFNFGEYQSNVVKNSIAALKPKIYEFINSKICKKKFFSNSILNYKIFEFKSNFLSAIICPNS